MRVVLVLCWLLAASQTANADELKDGKSVEPTAKERPWAKGVSASKQERALEEFRKGNERFANSDYVASVEFYRKGLAFWDHPALHGNLAVALIRLEQPLDAFRHIQLALRWDHAPLDSHVYEQLVTSRQLLESQLAQVVVNCHDAGNASVTLDGVFFTECPIDRHQYTIAGAHDLVARKSGHLTMVKRFTATPGKVSSINVSLVPLTEAVTFERRFSPWKSWTVAGAGAGLTLLGLGLSLKANSTIDNYDSEIDRLCPNGCLQNDIPQTVSALKSRASVEDSIALGSFVLGGIGLAVGASLLYYNRPRRVEVDADGRRVSVRPLLSTSSAGVSASFDF